MAHGSTQQLQVEGLTELQKEHFEIARAFPGLFQVGDFLYVLMAALHRAASDCCRDHQVRTPWSAAPEIVFRAITEGESRRAVLHGIGRGRKRAHPECRRHGRIYANC